MFKNHLLQSKAFSMFLILFFCGSLFLPGTKVASAEEVFPEVDAGASVLIEFSREEIIFAQNESEPLPPASLTKIMTLLIAYEALRDGKVTPEEEVVIGEEAWATGGSQMFLEIDQRVSFEKLITGIASISANDACVAIAEHLYGSEAAFVQEMNNKARELGLQNTHFQNTTGLPDPEHYASAEDIGRLAHYLIQNFPEALEQHSLKEFTSNDILQYNRNPLLGRYEGADGLKTGHTSAAGYCLAGTAYRDGMRFITVVMNAESDQDRLRDSTALLNHAFQNYTLEKIYSAGNKPTTIEVLRGDLREIDLLLKDAVEVVIPDNHKENLEVYFEIPENITAPIEKETEIGSVKVMLEDENLLESPLVASENVERAGTFSLIFRSLGDFFTGIWNGISQFLQDLVDRE